MDLQRRLREPIRNSSPLPYAFPVLAVLPILSSFLVSSWLVSQTVGYLLTGSVILVIVAYGLLYPGLRLQLAPGFLVLFGGYWVGLVVHYFATTHSEVLQYILVTPPTVIATVIVLPALIDDRRQAFTMEVTVVAVLLTLVGLGMLWQDAQTSESLYAYVGGTVLGIDGIRTVSIFHNPNTYGFVMMVGSLTALYTALVRRRSAWIGALGLCLLGLFLSDGTTSLVGFVVGAILVLSGTDRRLGFVGVAIALLGGYVAIRLGHVTTVMEGTLMIRVHSWVASLERLAADPLLGIGFADTAAQIGETYGPHNSYLYPPLSTGLLAGSLYLGALAYALGQGLRKSWTPWNAFVVGLSIAMFVYMCFESLFLGGLSVSSIVLGLCLGLLLYSSAADGQVEGLSAKFDIQ
ncbi:O-antigen ligase family protein [Natronococcus jeotgali]|uniref:O-antigen polymerase n=1 Tax=Natronococcus jeotgali DSM 18795 TaxID=1227498 RepID=L9X2W7_9EURY|nr:hypothetical protein [Natronococcus jeotgali]ELY55821.1 hypothetical protein C492_15226 [Natronococcus jeotgali DSM 18795]